MPQILPHIDAIAREKNRDVLFISFEQYEHHNETAESNQPRQALMQWLDEQKIAYQPCMGMEQPGMLSGYSGDLYVDVPYDESNTTYQILRDHLEDEQGNMKIDGVLFFALSLDLALEIEAEREDFWGFDETDEASQVTKFS